MDNLRFFYIEPEKLPSIDDGFFSLFFLFCVDRSRANHSLSDSICCLKFSRKTYGKFLQIVAALKVKKRQRKSFSRIFVLKIRNVEIDQRSSHRRRSIRFHRRKFSVEKLSESTSRRTSHSDHQSSAERIFVRRHCLHSRLAHRRSHIVLRQFTAPSSSSRQRFQTD